MNLPTGRTLVLVAFILADSTTGFGDMAEIKRKAEAGDPRAQHEFADALLSRLRSADALQWYSKAARQGDLEASYQVGRMLLYGWFGTPQDQSVVANPQE